MELHNLGIGFLRLAASFTVASLLFGFILPKKEQIVTVVASGFAGWFYIFVTWTGVFFDGYEFLFSLIAVAHFTHCIMWALQQRQIEFFISKKPKEKFGLLGFWWFEVQIEITMRGAD